MCILLVGDEELFRELLKQVMEGLGFDVLDAPDGETALLLSEVGPLPQLIIGKIDLGFGMDGFEFVTLARCRWPAVPVLMTGVVAIGFASGNRGMTEGFLAKPFSLGSFIHAVTELTGTLKGVAV